MKARLAAVACAAAFAAVLISRLAAAGGELPDTFFDERSAPAVAYATQRPHDAIAQLNDRLAAGSVSLPFVPVSGYLPAVLNALRIPVESQLAVFSKTSVQAGLISPANPRTLFFNDNVVVGWPRGGFIEAASVDPRLGVIFYQLDQRVSAAPRFFRRRSCTSCHQSLEATLSIPGMLVRSEATRADGRTMRQLGRDVIDHRLPVSKRWGGWYVTGRNVGIASLGNVMLAEPVGTDAPEAQTIALTSLEGRFPLEGYLSAHSDIAALMVFSHQMHMTNLLARMSWETRAAEGRPDAAALVDSVARDLVDYMLFIDEPALSGRLEGGSGFAEWFAAQGPADGHGRSLRQLDLTHRLLRFPCSYMIYTDAFDALPVTARDAIYRRMWTVLAGQEREPRYARLTPSDRQAIIEILRDTKKGLPDYFR